MKKKVLILGVCSLLLCGCGKIPTLSNGDEAVVTFKEGEMISANDFYEEIKNSFGLDTLLNMIDKHIFEAEFPDEMENGEAYAEAAIDQLRTNYETEEELLQALQYYGYQTVEAYQNFVYISYMQNVAIEAYVRDNITDEELNEVLETMKKFSNEFFNQLNINNLSINVEEKEKRIYISVTGDDINYLIGYRGETLNYLQLIFSNVANKKLKHKCSVILDIENYRAKRKVVLEELAEKISKTVVKNRKKIELEPMSAYERKIIHTKLQNNSKVKTYSVGEEPNRRIIIDLK